LGQACGLINIGTDQQKCVDQHPNDVNSPIISPWEETLTQGYQISKLPNGYEINPKVKPFTKITFGFKTNEPAQCKIDTKHTDSINEMPHFFNNDPNLITEHNLSLSLSGGQDYTYYLRCKDAKGNANQGEYAIKLSTEQTPDLSPPAIEFTSIEKGASIRSDVNNQTFSVYLNEPAECKWSLNDKAYDAMENLFVCNTETYEDQTFLNTYECLTILEPINQAKDNNYFIKCKDDSGNINSQTFKFTLRRSSPLTVSLTTDPTIIATKLTSNEFELKAATTGGSDEGKSACRFSQLGTTNYDNMVDFFTTSGTQHTQSLQLQEGRYELNVVCRDSSLNEAQNRIQFTLERDTQPPKLTQVYKQAGSVYINIDEDALCEYSDKTFIYGQGNPLSTTYLRSFQIQELKVEYWVACQDKFNNIMGPIHIVP
ncbi:MAG: hypothetical protein Q8R00_04855, partial [Candidatus Nanoarchaeia archaeon]|nr:hypothetical protein [Candidatus Nanoarchaeia archaeon]